MRLHATRHAGDARPVRFLSRLTQVRVFLNGEKMCEQETEMEMIRRHVRQGADRVVQQREMVAKLRASGQSTEVALQLLATFEAAQRQHKEHLERLEGGPPAAGAGRGDA